MIGGNGASLYSSFYLELSAGRCLGCQDCQPKSNTGHSSSAPACDLYGFLV